MWVVEGPGRGDRVPVPRFLRSVTDRGVALAARGARPIAFAGVVLSPADESECALRPVPLLWWQELP